MAGGGRKPIIGDLEDAIFDWFCDRRTRNLAVTRKQIQNFAINFAKNIPNANQSFKASNHWLDNFMTRYDMSLRSKSTLFRLKDEEVVNRVISYKRFFDNIDYSQYVLNECFAIDESAVYYGDYNRTTVDFRKATSVAIQATGYESERVTCILGLRLSGEKIPPLVIIKGATKPIVAKHGVWIISSEKAWSTQAVLRKYIERVSPFVARNGRRALLVWDAASTHRAADMKKYLAQRHIDQAMIPSGTTMYLQSLDIAINKPFKDYLREAVNEYTEHRLQRNPRGNAIKPSIEEVCGWISYAWNKITPEIVSNALKSAYLTPERVFEQTHIHSHEKFGALIANVLSENNVAEPTDLIIPEENDLDVESDISE